MTQPEIPGLIPMATLTLRAFLMPDGTIAHYEVEGRGPGNELTHFRAQSNPSGRPSDLAYTESSAYFEATLWTAYEAGRGDRGYGGTPDLP